jgi:mono/diheme cytochrome c family protein
MNNHVRVVIRWVALWSFAPLAMMFGQTGNQGSSRTQAGEQIFKSACAACHGADGRGTPKEIAGFEKPRTFPDFTQCDQTTPEASTAWKDVILHGGPTRGFSDIMPSFSEALTSEQIDDVIAYLRPTSFTSSASE